jgi:hypothetical protein
MEREPAAFLALLRRLLFSAAPYVLGSFGPPCALREHGERRAGTGSTRAPETNVQATGHGQRGLLPWLDMKTKWLRLYVSCV